MKRLLAIWLLVSPLACFGPSAEERLQTELLSLSKEEAFEKGKALIADEKWEKGRKYLVFVHENYPNDPISRDALLRLADSYYEHASKDDLVEALFRYRDYLSRYPGGSDSDYVMMRVGDVLIAQAETPDRDQSTTRKGLVQYQDALRMYPSSPRRTEILEKIGTARKRLAAHELVVGRFYCRRGLSRAAVRRLQGLLADYPEFESTDQALYWVVRAAVDAGELESARFFKKRLEAEYPDSKWAGKAPEVPELESEPAVTPISG